MTGELLCALEADAMACLRWLVLRAFCVLPGSQADRELTEEELLRCGLCLLWEAGGSAPEGQCNAAFDEARFAALKRGEIRP